MTTSERDWHDQTVSDAYAKQREASADDAPPAALDEAIRAAARSAVVVVVVPKSVWRPRMERWQTPLALAATVVLSASLILAIRGEYPEMLSTRPPEPKLLESKAMNTRIIEPPPPAVMAEKRVKEPARQIAQSGENAAAAAGSMASQNDSAAKREWGEPVAGTVPAERAVPAAAPPAAATRERRTNAPAIAAAPAAPAVPAASALSAPAEPAQTPAVAANRGDASAMATRAEMNKAKSVAADATVPPAPDSSTSNYSAAAAKPAAAAVADKVEKIQVTGSTITFSEAEIAAITSGWIAEMEALRKQAKWKELRAEKERFVKRFPKVPLPKDLQELPAGDK